MYVVTYLFDNKQLCHLISLSGMLACVCSASVHFSMLLLNYIVSEKFKQSNIAIIKDKINKRNKNRKGNT